MMCLGVTPPSRFGKSKNEYHQLDTANGFIRGDRVMF